MPPAAVAECRSEAITPKNKPNEFGAACLIPAR